MIMLLDLYIADIYFDIGSNGRSVVTLQRRRLIFYRVHGGVFHGNELYRHFLSGATVGPCAMRQIFQPDSAEWQTKKETIL